MSAELTRAFVTIATVWTAAVIIPGPNFVAAVKASLNGSRSTGVYLSCGIMLSTCVWALLGISGIGLLYQKYPGLATCIKILGCSYLVYLGIAGLLSRNTLRLAPEEVKRPTLYGGAKAFGQGFLVDFANPKAALFFSSLFSAALPLNAPAWFCALTVAYVSLAAGGWYMIVALLVGRLKVYLMRYERAITGAMSCLLILIGIALAWA